MGNKVIYIRYIEKRETVYLHTKDCYTTTYTGCFGGYKGHNVIKYKQNLMVVSKNPVLLEIFWCCELSRRSRLKDIYLSFV